MKTCLSIIILLLTFTAIAETYDVPVSSKPIKIDGVLDDEIWNDAMAVELKYEIDPANNAPAEVDENEIPDYSEKLSKTPAREAILSRPWLSPSYLCNS